MNVSGLPETTTAAPAPRPEVGNPEILVGSVKLAFAVTEFAGPTPSVQFGTVASPLASVVSVTEVVRVELDAGPRLPPPDATSKVTNAPPRGVCPFTVCTNADGAAATDEPAGAVCG